MESCAAKNALQWTNIYHYGKDGHELRAEMKLFAKNPANAMVVMLLDAPFPLSGKTNCGCACSAVKK